MSYADDFQMGKHTANVPDWVRANSAHSTDTLGEALEERIHLEIAYELKLAEIVQSQPTVACVTRLLIEFGASTARLLPSPSATLVAAGVDYLGDFIKWSIGLCIPHSSAGWRLLGMIRQLCDVDEVFFAKGEGDVPFCVSARSISRDKTAFVLTGYGDEALVQLQFGLKLLSE